MPDYKERQPSYDIFPPTYQGGAAGRSAPMHPIDRPLSQELDFSAWNPRWSTRRRARAVARTIVERTAGLEILRKYHEAATAFEEAYQALLAARARRGAVLLAADQEVLRLQTEIEKGRGALQAAIDMNVDLRARRFERRELEAEIHELEMLRKRRLILEERVTIERLEDKLRGNGEDRATAGSHREDPLDDYLRTEGEVRRARAAAAKMADAVRTAAAAQGRDISPEEADLISSYEAAAEAAEERIRRGGAADF